MSQRSKLSPAQITGWAVHGQDVIITSFLQHEMMQFGVPCFLDVGAVILLSVINNKWHRRRYPFAGDDKEAIRQQPSQHAEASPAIPLQICSADICPSADTFFVTINKRTFTSQSLGCYFKPPGVLQQWFKGSPSGSWGCLLEGSGLWYSSPRNPPGTEEQGGLWIN